jgi:WD40 repeat protein
VSVLEGHEYEIKCVDWHASKNLLCTCARDKSIWVWEYTDSYEFYCASIINAHSQDVKKARWISNKDFIVSSGYDNAVKVWQQDEEDEEEYYCLQQINKHDSIVWDA